MQPNSATYFNVYSLMAKQSPLNALRQIGLSVYELKSLTILLRALGHTDFADLVQAEAELREMLARRNVEQRCLN